MKGNTDEHDNCWHGALNCTFEITVEFMRNATWQGKICWLEKNKNQNFRSAFEMLKLMDEALTDTTYDAQTIKWEWG